MRISIQAIQAFALLVAANATPVIDAKLARQRCAWPLDCGFVLSDGERLFGAHKTWRGLAGGALASTVAAGLMGYGGGSARRSHLRLSWPMCCRVR